MSIGYVVIVSTLLLIIALIVLQNLLFKPRPRKKVKSKTGDHFSGTCTVTSYWNDSKVPFDPHRQRRGKLKKSKWAQMRKSRQKENRERM